MVLLMKVWLIKKVCILNDGSKRAEQVRKLHKNFNMMYHSYKRKKAFLKAFGYFNPIQDGGL